MNGFTLCVLVLCALPCALGLMCYKCSPSGPTSLCEKPPTNASLTTNCSASVVPGVTYDACLTSSIGIDVGPIKKKAFMMSCTSMKVCNKLKADKSCPNKTAAAIGLIPGAKLKGCAVACCQGDKCNTHKILPKPKGPEGGAAFMGASVLLSMMSVVFGYAVSV